MPLNACSRGLFNPACQIVAAVTQTCPGSRTKCHELRRIPVISGMGYDALRPMLTQSVGAASHQRHELGRYMLLRLVDLHVH